MDSNIGTIVCSSQEACKEVVRVYNPYESLIQAGVAIVIVVAIGILVICLIKRKSKKKENTQGDNL